MEYSAIMSELVDEIIDEALKSTREGKGAPPGVAYSADFTAQHADCAAGPDDCSVDPNA